MNILFRPSHRWKSSMHPLSAGGIYWRYLLWFGCPSRRFGFHRHQKKEIVSQMGFHRVVSSRHSMSAEVHWWTHLKRPQIHDLDRRGNDETPVPNTLCSRISLRSWTKKKIDRITNHFLLRKCHARVCLLNYGNTRLLPKNKLQRKYCAPFANKIIPLPRAGLHMKGEERGKKSNFCW